MREVVSEKITKCTSKKIVYDLISDVILHKQEMRDDGYIIKKTKSAGVGRFIVTYVKYEPYDIGGRCFPYGGL